MLAAGMDVKADRCEYLKNWLYGCLIYLLYLSAFQNKADKADKADKLDGGTP
jgi:hypothetical protein